MALISVIVPCYNVVKYIDRCMHTLVNQTIGIENLEIILVNDASTDNTLEKLLEWEKKYPDNVMVITYEENIRQGGARNVGMNYATSEYIGFVDSDDYIQFDMYEVLYNKAKEKGYGLVCGKMYTGICGADEFGQIQSTDEIHWKEYEYNFNGNWYEEEVETMPDTGSICTGIYLKNIIIDNGLWFPEKLAYEDNYWVAVLKLYMPNMCITDKIFYYYCVNEGSTVQKRNNLHQLDRLDTEIMIIEKYKQMGAFEYYREYLKKNFIRRFYLNTLHLVFTRFDYIPDIFGFMKEKVLEYFPDYNENNGIDNAMAQAVIGLLEIDRELTLNDWENVKRNYLNFLNQ